jgi:hypothetical protein
MDEIETQIKSLQNKYALQALLDIKIQEKTFDSTIQDKLAAIKTELANTRNMKIVNTRIVFEDKANFWLIGGVAIMLCAAIFNIYYEIRNSKKISKK